MVVYSEKNGWAEVKVNGKVGYVSTAFLQKTHPDSKPQEPAPQPVTKYVSVNPGSSLNLRNGPSTSAAIIGSLPNGTAVTVYSVTGGWAKVKVDGKEGYVSTEFLSDKKPGSEVVTEVMYVNVNPGSNLNMRNKPSLNGSIIIKLARGTEVDVYEIKNGWAKIKVYGQIGYVSAEYLSPTKPGTGSSEPPADNPHDKPGGNDGGNEQPNPGDGNNGQPNQIGDNDDGSGNEQPNRTPVATTMNNPANPGMITTNSQIRDDNNQPNPGDGSSEGDVVIKSSMSTPARA